MNKLGKYEQTLLEGWEDIHKKSQLTFWILFALESGEKHMNEIKEYIRKETSGIFTVDDQSMYRALRRFSTAELVTHYLKTNPLGPDVKIYKLTSTGSKVLTAFIQRNIASTYLNPRIIKKIHKIIGEEK